MIAPFALGALLLAGCTSALPLSEAPALVPRELWPRDGSGISRCASHLSAQRIMSIEDDFAKSRVPPPNGKVASQPINVYFHIIYTNETFEGGYVPDSQLQAQVETLNKMYAGNTPVTWKLANISRTQNEDWFTNVGPEESQQVDMKAKLRVGDAKDLNVYTVSFRNGSGKGLLGYSTFPHDYKKNPQDDGVVMQYSTFPGGTMPNYALGMTLAHEAGHWTGLYHTFQGGCDEPGDRVDDTAPEASAASGCPKDRKSCPNTGLTDPVTNVMDYTYDSCMTGFTAGQGDRMAAKMRTYRGANM